MNKEAGPAPAEAEGVNVPKRERVMPSIEDVNKANAAERAAAERREKGETPSGRIERIVAEIDAEAQSKLIAQNTGLLNRLTNVAKRGWAAVKGIGKIFGFIKEDVILPVKDAFSDIVTGRKEDGEAVGEVAQRIDTLQTQISTATPEARGALERQLADAQDEMAELRDPHNAARERAAREKAEEKAAQADAKKFMKSEEERMKAEKLAEDAAAAQKRHAEKLEREAMEREARANLGRGAAMLIVKAAGEDPEKMTLSDRELLAIGAVIEGAKAAIKMPDTLRAGAGKMKAGVENYLDDEKAKARAAWELTRSAMRGMVMADDFGEMYDNLKDAKDAAKKTIGASLSLTASALMNKGVQEGVIEALGLEEYHDEILVAGDEEGDGTVEVQSGRDLLLKTLKGGAVKSKALMGKAVMDVYEGVRDSEIVKDYTPAAQKVGRGLKYGALGTGALIASPILIPGAGIYFGGKAIGRGYTEGKAAAQRGYDALEGAAARKFMEVAPAIGDAIDPVITDTLQFLKNAQNVPGDARKELTKVGEDLNAVLLSTAEDINANTRKAAEAYNTLAKRLKALEVGAVALFHRLEAEAISEAVKAKNPELAEDVKTATTLEVQLTQMAKNAADAPEPQNVRPVIRQVRGSNVA